MDFIGGKKVHSYQDSFLFERAEIPMDLDFLL